MQADKFFLFVWILWVSQPYIGGETDPTQEDKLNIRENLFVMAMKAKEMKAHTQLWEFTPKCMQKRIIWENNNEGWDACCGYWANSNGVKSLF